MFKFIFRPKWPVDHLRRACCSSGKIHLENRAICSQNDLKCDESNDAFSKKSPDNIITSIDLNRSTESTINCDLIRRANSSSLINIIEQNLQKFKSKEIECVLERVISLVIGIKNQRGHYNENRAATLFDRFISTLDKLERSRALSAFSSLLNRTANLIDQLDTNCLIKVVQFYQIMKIEIDKNLLKAFIKKLASKCQEDELTLDEYLRFWRLLNHLYQDRDDSSNPAIVLVKKTVLRMAKDRLLDTKFKSNSMPQMVNYLNIFLNLNDDNSDSKVIKHLIDTLQSPEFKFNFKSSVKLLKMIKKSADYFHKDIDLLLQELKLNELIDKCNSTIYRTLVQRPTSDNAFFYSINLHNFKDELTSPKYFENIYDPKLLNILSPVLMTNVQQHPTNLYLIYRMMINLSRFEIYDERLLEFCYYKVISEHKGFLLQLGVSSFFDLYAKFRLPFVDYQRLADRLIYECSNQIDFTRATTALIFLSNLILTDTIVDKQLFDRLCSIVENDLQNVDSFKSIKDGHFLNRIRLAKAYLMAFRKDVRFVMQSRIDSKLDEYIDRLSKLVNRPKSNLYSAENSKLSKRSFLSNGVYLHMAAIYDRSTRDLVPFTRDHEIYLDKIDRLPLDADKQLLAIIPKQHARGNMCDQYEKTYNYRLKQFAKKYHIKTIEVDEVKLEGLDIEKRVNLIVEQSLTSCE